LCLDEKKMAEFEVLPGLPTYGPMAKTFSATGQGMHCEGFVVRFMGRTFESWVGNFQPGLTKFSGVHEHPDAKHVIVISGGEGYIVDPELQTVSMNLGGMINSVTPIPDKKALLFEEVIHLRLIDPSGIKWCTKRLSWDGIRNISVDEGNILGEAADYTDTWYPFKVSLDTGKVNGGAYSGPNP
jgi:hypothetical protein